MHEDFGARVLGVDLTGTLAVEVVEVTPLAGVPQSCSAKFPTLGGWVER